MTAPAFCDRPCDQPYADLGYRVMLAPNRYRKLFGATPAAVDFGVTDEGEAFSTWASAGVRLVFMADTEKAQAAALEMQRADWPELAHLAAGMEPHVNLCDEVLIWRAP